MEQLKSNCELADKFSDLMYGALAEQSLPRIPGIVDGIRNCHVDITEAVESDRYLDKLTLFDEKAKGTVPREVRNALAATARGEIEDAKNKLKKIGGRLSKRAQYAATKQTFLKGLGGRDVNSLFQDADQNRGYDGND